MKIDAILFDKDGTLWDYQATWAPWTAGFIRAFATQRRIDAAALAGILGFDLANSTYLAHSPLIAGQPEDIATPLREFLSDEDFHAFFKEMQQGADEVEPVPVKNLRDTLMTLEKHGYPMGVATNDWEGAARAQLKQAGIDSFFQFITGSDSGYPAKPDPDMLVAFARHAGLAPENILMVGDSRHDITAARAAGMPVAGVLSGVAVRADLEPFADIVFATVAEIPEWLQAQG